MEKTFFMKYPHYRTGVRLFCERNDVGLRFGIEHNTEPAPEDRICRIRDLQKELKQAYPTDPAYEKVYGGPIHEHCYDFFLDEMLRVSESMYRKSPAERARRKKVAHK